MTEPVARSGTLRVLLLEDSAFDAEILHEWLKRSYAEVQLRWVQNERDFAAELARGEMDVILSDYEMPGFSGVQALDMALVRQPSVPFIFVSGVIGEDNAVDMLKRGAIDYVIKGRLSRLPVAIDRSLDDVRLREARETAVAKLRHTDAQLRDADALYARVVDSLRDYAVILLDLEGTIRGWNRAATAIFGHPRDEAMGQPVEILFTPEDRAAGVPRADMATATEQGRAQDDRWLLRADGTQLRGEGVLTPILSADGTHTGFSKLVHDATAAYRDAQALREAKDEAERANRSKDRFLAMLSHELRTPLSPITAAAHMLERCAVVPERAAHLLPMIRRNVALEARLIDDLLDLTAIGAGKISLRLQPVDVHRLVAAVAEMLDGDFKRNSLTLVLRLDAPHSTVQGDEARLQQVLWNVVRNAVKFTPAGGQVEVQTQLHGNMLEIRCTDTGIGIHADALPRIFQAFEQADADVSKRFGGLGLGLAIAHGLVVGHGGSMRADSPGRDRGATFTLRLPLNAGEAIGAAALAEAETPTRPPQTVRLLLVEDNRDAADAMGLSLSELGYRVAHAATFQDAIDLAEGETFDIVVTDLGLPDGSGIEIGRRLHERMPVIALSGYGARSDLDESSAAGFTAHLVKPVAPAAVHAAIQAAFLEQDVSRQEGI